ncbi:MAG: hypothetical protein M1834_009040, partial [Cirrosporium novae-zelandiae]
RPLYPDGAIYLNDDSAEGVKSSIPRSDPNNTNPKTDIFASGLTIYFMIKGNLALSAAGSLEGQTRNCEVVQDEAVSALGKVLGGDVIKKCWAGEYELTDEVIRDLRK